MMNYYASKYFSSDMRTRSGKIPIKNVLELSVRTIIFTITRIAGSTTLHLDLKSQIQYFFECM